MILFKILANIEHFQWLLARNSYVNGLGQKPIIRPCRIGNDESVALKMRTNAQAPPYASFSTCLRHRLSYRAQQRCGKFLNDHSGRNENESIGFIRPCRLRATGCCPCCTIFKPEDKPANSHPHRRMLKLSDNRGPTLEPDALGAPDRQHANCTGKIALASAQFQFMPIRRLCVRPSRQAVRRLAHLPKRDAQRDFRCGTGHCILARGLSRERVNLRGCCCFAGGGVAGNNRCWCDGRVRKNWPSGCFVNIGLAGSIPDPPAKHVPNSDTPASNRS